MNEFRFLVICQGASYRLDERLVNLTGIVNELETTGNEPIELNAIVGVILRPPMVGKRLDLIAWKFGKKGEPLPLDGYVGSPLVLPKGLGPVVLALQVNVPIRESGVYGFYLFDFDGTFGPKEALLATYIFSVTVKNVE